MRLQSKASQSAASGSFAPAGQLLLEDGGDDPVEDRRVGRRLAEVVRRSRHHARVVHRVPISRFGRACARRGS